MQPTSRVAPNLVKGGHRRQLRQGIGTTTKDEVTEPDPGSNPSDDKDAAILEDHEDDLVVEEITSLIDSLSEHEQIDLVALAWLGRDDYTASDWPAVREEEARAHNNRTAEYLLGMVSRCSDIPAKNSRSSGCNQARLKPV